MTSTSTGTRQRMYVFERAYVDYAGYFRAFLRYVGRVSRAVWDWFWKGPGARVMDVILRIAVVVSGVAFGVTYVSYEKSHGRGFGIETFFAFCLIAAYVSLLMWGWKAPVHAAARAASGACASGTILALGALSFAAAFLVFMVYLAVLAVLTSLSFFVFLPMRLGQEIYLLYRQIAYECPHDCATKGKKLPVHICECGREYRDLKPSFYGIFHHKCRHRDGNYVKLPTMDMLGRYKLQRKCADCGGYLINSPYGPSRPFSVAVVGPKSVGKTMFLLQAIRALCARLNSDSRSKSVIVDERKLARDFGLLDRGVTVAQTVGQQDAFAMAFKTRGKRTGRTVLQMFDAPGEDFQTMEKFAKKQVFDRVNGIVLLVDPFSMPALSDRASKLGALKPVNMALPTVVGNLVALMKLRKVPSRGGKFEVPLAVVLSKCDALPVSQMPYLANLYSSNGDHLDGDTLNDRCRKAFEEMGGGNAFRSLQQHFERVRYFACTAQGRMHNPADTRPFQPAGVAEPFAWMLGMDGAAADRKN